MIEDPIFEAREWKGRYCACYDTYYIVHRRNALAPVTFASEQEAEQFCNDFARGIGQDKYEVSDWITYEY